MTFKYRTMVTHLSLALHYSSRLYYLHATRFHNKMQSDRHWTDEQNSCFQNVHTKVYAREAQLVAERDGDRGFDRDLFHQVVQQELPTDQEQADYHSWVIDRFAASTKTRRETAALTVDDYKNVVLNTNLVDKNQVLQLARLLDRNPYPYIGIGHHKGQHYRLKPMPVLLEVQKEDIWEDDPHQCAEFIIKGINISSGDAKFADPVKDEESRNGDPRIYFDTSTEVKTSEASLLLVTKRTKLSRD
jgi:hypothetical protein